MRMSSQLDSEPLQIWDWVICYLYVSPKALNKCLICVNFKSPHFDSLSKITFSAIISFDHYINTMRLEELKNMLFPPFDR